LAKAAIVIPLYSRVAINREIPESGLRRGDVATLLDRVPHPHGGETGVVLEIVDAVGQSLKTVVIAESQIVALHEGDVLSVRSLAPT
jgi:hypothetical protein